MIDTSPNVVLVVVAAALAAVGVYLMLERSLTRVLIGIVLLSNGVNVVFLVSGGRAGGAPIIGVTEEGAMSDPLPQAMVLTAIVITLGTTAFLLAMAYRSWQLNGHDEVQDDVEDRRVAERAAAHTTPFRTDDEDYTTLEQEAAEAQDDVAEPEDDDASARTPVAVAAPVADDGAGAGPGGPVTGTSGETPDPPRSAEGGDVR